MRPDLDHLRQWIGRSESRSETVTQALAERFAATLDLPAPGGEGAEAATMIHLCLAPPAIGTEGLGADGHPERGGFLPPVALPRRMWAGGAMAFHQPLTIGMQATRHSTIRDVTVKSGRSGVLCFVTVDHQIEAGGHLLIEERQDIVYRDVSPAPVAAPQPVAASLGEHRVTLHPSPMLLFRYSALTFNSHRIHYDLPYSREVEHYPGLVVHGPLQATLLMRFAEQLHGKSPARFSFRSLSPLFDTTPLTLNATPDRGGLSLWTAAPEGPVAMEARAEW